ncbi:unannotated protein [freshwater metagenome]|uniref:Unannotated protein n=1 Tax=freshwater metagenome TaxID=449393 RepID=A0A6J7H0D9_9ZZZZ
MSMRKPRSSGQDGGSSSRMPPLPHDQATTEVGCASVAIASPAIIIKPGGKATTVVGSTPTPAR